MGMHSSVNITCVLQKNNITKNNNNTLCTEFKLDQGSQRHFLRPAMLFGNLQWIICVAKCLEKRCREIIESKLNDVQCGFHPGRSTTDRISLSSKILRNLGSMLKTSSQLCRPRESIRPGSLWKALGSVAWVRCWRPPVTGRQVTIFLLRNLCPFRES